MTYFNRFLALLVLAMVAAIPAMAQNEVVKHTVEKGETLYGICKRYGVTEEQVINLNPGMKASSLKSGQVIIISEPEKVKEEIAQRTSFQPHSGPQKYVIKDGETLYSIATANGITTADILAANPTLNPTFYRGGDEIIIPTPYEAKLIREATQSEVSTNVNANAAPVKAVEDNDIIPVGTTNITIEENITPETTAPVKVYKEVPRDAYIAVILPFQKNVKNRTKASAQANDFMRGFFVAVDTMKTNRRPVKLYVYDSSNNTDSVKSILKRPELKKMQVIVAPGDSTHMSLINKFGEKNGIMVINPFLGLNQDYRTSSTMMQATVPKDVFNDKTIKGIAMNFPGRTPVILRREGAPGKEKDFVNQLSAAYREQGLEPIEISYKDKLNASDLDMLASRNGNYIFLPMESNNKESLTYLPALAEFTATLQDQSRVMVMGYPEWIVFGGDSRKNMEKTNTVIPSRFFVDNTRVEVKDAARQFNHWYKRQLESGFPRQGLMGIDLGMFIIKALRDNGGDFEYISPEFDGIQGGYHFVKTPGEEGWHNDLMYLIQYRPSGLIEKIVL